MIKSAIAGVDEEEEETKHLLLDAGFSLYITIHYLLDFLQVDEKGTEAQAVISPSPPAAPPPLQNPGTTSPCQPPPHVPAPLARAPCTLPTAPLLAATHS